jgi:hypothetical protein
LAVEGGIVVCKKGAGGMPITTDKRGYVTASASGMNRVLGVAGVIVGVALGVVGVLPTHWFGRLNGLGGSGHLSADGVVALGVVVLIVGIIGLAQRPPATKEMNRRTELSAPRDTRTGL